MDLLRIEHTDFTLTVESTRFDAMWQKGVGNLGAEKLRSTYRWGDGVERVVLLKENDEEREIIPDMDTEPAVFFEQTDYSVWVDFKSDKVMEARFDSPRKDVNERFSWKKDKQLLAGFLNYGNEIGRADMPIVYTLDGVQKRFVFSYDVISAKLDYHNDWKIIVNDIEEEYRMLSLDYLRRTYHGIQEGSGETFDLIWWNIFHSLQEQFIKACHNIIDRPRHRLRSIEDYKRADQIRHFTPMLEQQIAEHRNEETRLYRVETKDIATLYEIWCFIQVEKVVMELTHADVEQDNRQELNGLFTYSLGKGEHSKIIFKKDDVTLVELIYNPRHSEKDDVKGISDLVSKTVPQKPDIVLQLTKDDLQEGMKLTYLFDAKYRLEKDGTDDVPPDDAINQMHRYRDAIYFNAKHDNEQLKKEVIGGYILFPGKMDEFSRFRHSIDEVNIGAFPMRPDQKQHQLLTEFIADLLRKKAVEVVEQVIPQKGTTLAVKNRVLVGVVKEDNPQYSKFLDGTATQYYSGDTFPTTIPLDGINFFVPYIQGKGVRDLYEVTGIHTATKAKGAEDDKLRITFELKYARPLFDDYRIVPLPIVYTFNDTSLDQLRP